MDKIWLSLGFGWKPDADPYGHHRLVYAPVGHPAERGDP
jgi:hypothetical protein